ncbi:XkdX family protein [Staphylococcus xylosus]|nr:XkdX family protein [Staphylococcus xylosus]RIM80118.1 XkdX family protein [Staphylococcus xylosus]
MFTTLKRLYDLELFDKQKIFESVKCNWITKEEYEAITGLDYPEQLQA